MRRKWVLVNVSKQPQGNVLSENQHEKHLLHLLVFKWTCEILSPTILIGGCINLERDLVTIIYLRALHLVSTTPV